MSLQGDFLSHLESGAHDEREALEQLHKEVTGKVGTPGPIEALQDVRKWLNMTAAKKLSPVAVTALHDLCNSQQRAALEKELPIISHFYSSSAAASHKTRLSIAKSRCEALMKKASLDPSEKAELVKLLREGTLDKFSKSKQKELLREFSNPLFINELKQDKYAFMELCRSAYANGMLYHLLKDVNLDASAQQWIQEPVIVAMRRSIAHSKSEGVLAKLGIRKSSPTLRIPLDPTRESLNPQQAQKLDAILGRACLTAVVMEEMRHGEAANVEDHAKFLGQMITSTPGDKCTIAIPKPAFNNERRTRQILKRYDQLSRAGRNFIAYVNTTLRPADELFFASSFDKALQSAPGSADPDWAHKDSNQAAKFDLLGLFADTVDLKKLEQAIVTPYWDKAKADFQSYDKFPNKSSQLVSELSKARQLLNKAPTLEGYSEWKSIRERLQKLTESRFEHIYEPTESSKERPHMNENTDKLVRNVLNYLDSLRTDFKNVDSEKRKEFRQRLEAIPAADKKIPHNAPVTPDLHALIQDITDAVMKSMMEPGETPEDFFAHHPYLKELQIRLNHYSSP